MRTKELTISKDFAMLPDAVAELVQTACRFESSSYAIADEKRINLKSIMGVMSLVAVKSNELVIEIDGKDEDLAFNTLAGFWT
ncbi:MAG: HPr family phosphocarrier protein [Catonella sp.]|uniref:HPr family phosphocarrier protein n=1 Tax=Catonella sp. TaxID=2382125 RepID=UPI003FA08238